MFASESTFVPLRRRERERRIMALRQRLQDTLVPNDCSVWLFGSLARGDWDGFSDIDLLVVGANQDEAERAANQLVEALVGDDVLAIDHGRWQAMACSPSPHWRANRAQAIRRYPLEDTPPMDLFEPTDSEQAITTATAVLAWVERLDQGGG
jgi:predicted nucleotidyltransferase